MSIKLWWNSNDNDNNGCCYFNVGHTIKKSYYYGIFFYILILFLVISCGNNKSKDYPNIIVNASVVHSYDTVVYRDTIKHNAYDIRLSIKNKSNKPISFWIMTCSWEENFIINNDYIQLLRGGCDSNYPNIKTLKPNDSLVYKTKVIKYDYTRFHRVKTTRFGFIYIDLTKCKYVTDFENIIGDKSKHDNLIWSNPLYLNEIK